MSRNGLIVLVVVLIGLFVFTRHSSDPPAATAAASTATTTGHDPPAFGGSGKVDAHLNAVPMIRSVTVSPDAVNFGSCTGGQADTASQGDKIGYPNGTCWVGGTGPEGTFPITVTYTGLSGNVWVSSTNVIPSDNGTNWSLCYPSNQAACTGGGGMPGSNQVMVSTFAPEVATYQMLTDTALCDAEFDPGGGCSAAPAEFQSVTAHEGIRLIGPAASADGSTSWHVTITWIAEYPH